jgi:DNA-binding GntR family transcriptional regulator
LRTIQNVKAQEFADYFNVSITPVRETFQRLQADGYLTVTARNEFKVIGLSMDEIKMVFALSRVLDIYEIEKNLENFSDKLINDLKR